MEKEAVLGMAADIGRVIGIPDFSVEVLSLAWEERLSAGMDEIGVPEAERAALRRYARGWRP